MGLLDRAKKMMQGRSAPAPSRSQYYSVACVEGHVLHGQRTDGYQALRCPTCGEGIFVLPRSPLPEPAAPASAGGASPARRRPTSATAGDELVLADPPSPAESAQARAELAASRTKGTAPGGDSEAEPEAEIEWVDEAEGAPVAAYTPETSLDAAAVAAKPKAARPSAANGARAKPARPKAARVEPAPAPVPAGMVRVEEARPGLKEWAWRRKNALIAATVAAVVIGTVALRLRQGRLEEYPKIAEIGRIQGLTKLDLGDFHVAKKLLGDASAAVDALGGQYEGADAIRQGAREAAIFADLVGAKLEDLVEMAAKKFQSQTEWAAHFDAIYKGQAVILEADVEEVPDPAGPEPSYRINYRIFYGGETHAAGRGRINLAGFKLFEQAQPKRGDHVTFGARLAAIHLDTASGEYLVDLAPDSGVFLTHYKALEYLGWPAAEPVADEEAAAR